MSKIQNDDCEHGRRWPAFSQEGLAEATNTGKAAITQWVREGLPRWPAGKNRHRYCIPCTLNWKATNRPAESIQVNPGDDVDLLIGTSPGLERYRLAKAALAELDLEVRKGSLLSVDRVKDGLLRAAMMIRRLGERLGKRYGNDATIAVNETVLEFERITIGELNNHDNQAAD